MDTINDKIWIGSPTDVRTGKAATAALQKTNDKQYWHDEYGIIEVPRDRWEQAQHYELSTWRIYKTATQDRNHEHYNKFNGYKHLPQNLGRVAEFGCGPFTQLQTIMQGRPKLEEIHLIDPLIEQYLKLPNCTYTDGFGYDSKTIFYINSTIEDLLGHICAFDTIIMINVLEHVYSVKKVFETILRTIDHDGILVFGENTWDHVDPKCLYDVGHPIRAKLAYIELFKASFEILYENKDHPGYFIGKIT